MEKENEIKNVLKVKRKVFTKEESNIIIKKNYNPFTVNKNLRKKGLCMKRIENVVLNEIKNELNWKEKIIVRIVNKTFNKVADLIRINTVNNLIK